MKHLTVQLKFEPRDLWVGIFWDHTYDLSWGRSIAVYVCLLPMLPIKFTWHRGHK